MNKDVLTRFISKYHLSGNINTAIWRNNDSTLSTRFISGDKSLLGNVSLDEFDVEDFEMGVYNTNQLSSLLGVVGNDINLDILRSEDKCISLKVKDDTSSVNYMLSDLSVINRPPDLKNVPDFTLTLDIDSNFINKFINGKSVLPAIVAVPPIFKLPDTETFTILTDESDSGAKVVIGWSEINSNRVELPVNVTEFDKLDNISFNANLFKDVLVANKECGNARLRVSKDGLAHIKFQVDKYVSEYFLVASANKR